MSRGFRGAIGATSAAWATAAAMSLLAPIASAQVDSARGAGARPQPQASGPAAHDVTIPFVVGPATCTDRSRQYTVSMRIYNVLAQIVAVPTLRGEPGAEAPPAGAVGRVLNRVMLPCGRYGAYWNGRHMTTGRNMAAGVYLYELVIDDQRVARKLTLTK